MKISRGKKNSMLDKMHDHFLHIAPRYKELRTTDLGPLLHITNKIKNLQNIQAADIGCGTGRYSLKFVEQLGEKCHLFCVDNNEEMLHHLKEDFAKHNITNFTPIHSDSHRIPLQTDSLDCVMSFNAIHHFPLPDFLRESSRILKNNGKLFVYTRLRDQNAKTIWGMHFPSFTKKESRLYELEELKSAFEKDPNLNINSVKLFEHNRVYPLERLVEQAKNHHYSTFRLYKRHEFKDALHKFVQNILNHYNDLDKITWKDQNTLLVVENRQ
ncbi:MAG: methyltransferase domain-containing protein [Thaumarchaeota archaeon]|nr:methyltransferase domain-containing protein [Nitrososphaerota archaeon]